MSDNIINIILVDDHPVVRGGIVSILEKEKQFKIVGEASNGLEMLDSLAGDSIPDVILVDINMPGMGGLELTEKLHIEYPQMKVVLLSAFDSEQYVIQAFKSGAAGYLLKNLSAFELVFAIRYVYGYGNYICAELAERFLHRLYDVPNPSSKKSIQDVNFSSMDINILTLIAEGHTNQEIADKLFASKRTIENHRQQMIDKTGSRNTIALVRFAMLNGII